MGCGLGQRKSKVEAVKDSTHCARLGYLAIS